MNVQIVTEGSLTSLLKSGTVIVEFWAPWCGPCRQVAPMVEEMAQACNETKIAKLNIDEFPQVAAGFGISGVPTLAVFEEGTLVKTMVGAKPKALLWREVSTWLR